MGTYTVKNTGESTLFISLSQYGQEAILPGKSFQVDVLNSELLELYDSGVIVITPAPGSSSGGSGGSGGITSESDPTVNQVVFNSLSADTGARVKGATLSLVLKGDLGTVFDFNTTEAGKVSVPTFALGKRGLVPATAAGDAAKFLRGDGAWTAITTYSAFTGATVSTAGVAGLVPAPAIGDQNKVLFGSGVWGTVTMPSNFAGATALANGGNGLVPAPLIADRTRVLSGAATWVALPTTFSGATASAAGSGGLVPAPASGKQGDFLRGDGTWAAVSSGGGTTMTAATSTAAGTGGLVPAPAIGDQGKVLSGAATWVDLPSGGSMVSKSFTTTANSKTATIYVKGFGAQADLDGATITTAATGTKITITVANSFQIQAISVHYPSGFNTATIFTLEYSDGFSGGATTIDTIHLPNIVHYNDAAVIQAQSGITITTPTAGNVAISKTGLTASAGAKWVLRV